MQFGQVLADTSNTVVGAAAALLLSVAGPSAAIEKSKWNFILGTINSFGTEIPVIAIENNYLYVKINGNNTIY